LYEPQLIKRIFFHLARSPLSDFFIGHVFAHLSFLLPDIKANQQSQVLVLRHPLPSSGVHLLAVPKLKVRNFMDLDLTTHSGRQLTLSLLRSLTEVAVWLKLNRYTLILNGGKYQDVPQLHVHLIDANLDLPAATPAGKREGYPLVDDNSLDLGAGPFNLILNPILPQPPLTALHLSDPDYANTLLDLIVRAQHILRQHEPSSFRLIFVADEPMQIHLIGNSKVLP
jgi:diadenosine tetraphosphate (Ap4A) HIT family hydrolase